VCFITASNNAKQIRLALWKNIYTQTHTLRMQKQLTAKIVASKNKEPMLLDNIDDLIYFDVYEGYRKVGRYKLGQLRIKFQ
jgi:phage-related protein